MESSSTGPGPTRRTKNPPSICFVRPRFAPRQRRLHPTIQILIHVDDGRGPTSGDVEGAQEPHRFGHVRERSITVVLEDSVAAVERLPGSIHQVNVTVGVEITGRDEGRLLGISRRNVVEPQLNSNVDESGSLLIAIDAVPARLTARRTGAGAGCADRRAAAAVPPRRRRGAARVIRGSRAALGSVVGCAARRGGPWELATKTERRALDLWCAPPRGRFLCTAHAARSRAQSLAPPTPASPILRTPRSSCSLARPIHPRYRRRNSRRCRQFSQESLPRISGAAAGPHQ